MTEEQTDKIPQSSQASTNRDRRIFKIAALILWIDFVERLLPATNYQVRLSR
jgi:hypothetical protein